MIHNGIEYGMMASLAEGLNILGTASTGDAPYNRFDFDLPALTELWRRGSVVSSWLLDLTAASLATDPSQQGFSGRVSDSGEGRWTVQSAVDLGVPAHALTAALFDRYASRGNAATANKLLSAMRAQFGGHVEPKDEE
jgi:6-phosphogluconate dehydrogenase